MVCFLLRRNRTVERFNNNQPIDKILLFLLRLLLISSLRKIFMNHLLEAENGGASSLTPMIQVGAANREPKFHSMKCYKYSTYTHTQSVTTHLNTASSVGAPQSTSDAYRKYECRSWYMRKASKGWPERNLQNRHKQNFPNLYAWRTSLGLRDCQSKQIFYCE